MTPRMCHTWRRGGGISSDQDGTWSFSLDGGPSGLCLLRELSQMHQAQTDIQPR